MEQKPELENQQVEIDNQAQNSGDQNPDQGNFWTKEVSRRDALKLALKGGVVLVGSSAAVVGARKLADVIVPPNNELQEPDPNVLQSPEKLKSDIEFGFNTHVHTNPAEGDNMTLEAFKGDVDRLVEANQDWIRFNLINEGTVTQNADGSLNFTEGIEVFDQAIDYAKQKGLKIAFVTNAPESLASSPIDEYIDKAAAFYTQLALRYGEKIDTWQIFNEADSHHFRNYQSQSDFDQAYIDELEKVITASTQAIRTINPDSKITMNASLWGPDKNAIRNRTERFFDALSQHLDFISLDPYPDVYDPNAATTIPQDIEHFQKRYGKDIVIAEIGVSALDIPDSQKRSGILLSYLSAIKSGNVQPEAVFAYQMRHEDTNPDPREAKFGTRDIFNQLTQQMQAEQPEADQKTNTTA